MKIKSECDVLEERWPELRERVVRWREIIEDAVNVRSWMVILNRTILWSPFQRMKGFDKTIQDCNEVLDEAETARSQWIPVKDIQLDDLPNQMEQTRVRLILSIMPRF